MDPWTGKSKYLCKPILPLLLFPASDPEINREEELDSQIALTQQELRLLGEDSVKSALAFVTYSEVCNLSCFGNQVCIIFYLICYFY